ncbi:MAG: tyrosine-type recombinase/integrase [Halovenus sp.]
MSEADDTRSYEIEVPGTADGGDRVPDLSPREARDRWLDKLRVSKAESSVSAYHYQTKLFVEWCERQDIDEIADLSGWDIESYETYRRGEGVKPYTLQKELGTLRRFLEYCARIELVDDTLPEKVDPPDPPRDAQVDETMLRPERAQQLLEFYRTTSDVRATRGHVLLELAWYTGARLGALRGLDVHDYDSDEQYVAFRHRPSEDTPLKNGTDGERVVGLPDVVTDVVDTYLAHERHEVHDDCGRKPLLASTVGRPSTNAVRAWMYQATVPCLYADCPHGRERESCEFLEDSYNNVSKCPSSRSPHQVRTGSITWQRNQGVPADVVSRRVNSSVRVIEQHYDKPDEIEEMEKRRRQYLENLEFDGQEEEDQ